MFVEHEIDIRIADTGYNFCYSAFFQYPAEYKLMMREEIYRISSRCQDLVVKII